MAAITSGFNYSTLSESGYALNICTTTNTIVDPEYPLPPFPFGTKTIGLDNSEWVYVKPSSNYAIGTVGYIDSSWNFTALTTANSVNVVGQEVAVLSQIASVTANPTQYLYDAVWVQTSGLCPAVSVVANTSANALLYTTTTPGALSSSLTGGALSINNITTLTASTGARTEPGIIN